MTRNPRCVDEVSSHLASTLYPQIKSNSSFSQIHFQDSFLKVNFALIRNIPSKIDYSGNFRNLFFFEKIFLAQSILVLLITSRFIGCSQQLFLFKKEVSEFEIQKLKLLDQINVIPQISEIRLIFLRHEENQNTIDNLQSRERGESHEQKDSIQDWQRYILLKFEM